MPTPQQNSISIAHAEDTYDLLSHIAWTDVIKPELDKELRVYSSMLVAEALGTKPPGNLTREQIAGRAYGIQFISSLFEKILAKGEKAVAEIKSKGISLS